LSLDTWADLKIIIFSDEPAIQQLKVHVIVCFKRRVALSLAFEPDSVVVPAVPALDIPPVVTRTFTAACFGTVFKDVDEREETVLLVVDRGRSQVAQS
jgi:hypothetical protein